ncbi:MAG: P13 family porin [Sphaerochaeta sp.]|nr:P13 family porin [Sphaerochaeta sp.]
MKKPTILICVLLVSFSALFASQSPVASISLMIDTDLAGNFTTITKESEKLSDFEKMSLYSMHENSPTLPFVVNLLVGYGIGSFLQGDTKTGTTALVADIVALGLYSVGYVQIYNAAFNGEISGPGHTMFLLGVGLLVGSKIYQCTKPFSYAKAYNRRLHSSLLGKAEVFVTPVITAVNNQVTLGMVGKVSF